jgi:hypothetical protein
MSIDVFILLIVFQFKHLIADYYLQFPYMYLNKGKSTGWIKPLVDHSFIHAAMTMMILCIYFLTYKIDSLNFNDMIMFLLLPLFDFVTHFITDRWKARKKDRPDQSKFWISLGIDQMIHHIVGIIIIFGITTWNV